MSGVEGAEREDYDGREAGVERGFRLRALGFGISVATISTFLLTKNPHFWQRRPEVGHP